VRALRTRIIAKLRHAALAAGLALALAASFASPALADAAAGGTPSEFEIEKAMSVAERIERWAAVISEASLRFAIPEDWIRRVIRRESEGRTWLNDKRPLRSRRGAIGIMQLMPRTYRLMQKEHGLGDDPYDTHDNILAGAAYLRLLHDRYGYPRMFAAYRGRIGPAHPHRHEGRHGRHVRR
jgi:soluble lytic murein transglycosylase-like protein